MVYFLICTQESRLYLNNVQLINIFTMYRQLLIEPLVEIIRNPNLLGGPISCSWWLIPIHSGPLPGSNCPTLWLLTLSPFSHILSPHYTIYNDDISNHCLCGLLLTNSHFCCCPPISFVSSQIFLLALWPISICFALSCLYYFFPIGWMCCAVRYLVAAGVALGVCKGSATSVALFALQW
jgi:hypothetical protein